LSTTSAPALCAAVGVETSAASHEAMHPPARTFTHAHRQRLERAVEIYLRDCYRRVTAARVAELAARLGVTPEYLSRIAPHILGVPIRDFMRRRQVAYAAQLLKATPLTAEDIALRSAFGSIATFYRWFCATEGTTPDEFREVKK
jgi:AraC-like DNA-binding protein